MGRVVYVSFLGDNPYLAGRYEYNGKVSKVTKFVQEADISFFKDEINEYIFFLSKDARENNWENNENYKHKKEFSEGVKGLKTILEELEIESEKIKEVDIENILHFDGKINTQSFVNKLFVKIIEEIPENSELIVDVTHSFRSIPFVSLTAFKYLGKIKNVKIKHLFYGAFEELGKIREIEKIPIEKRIAPIIDLKPLLFLEEFSEGVEDFKLYGRVTKLKNLFGENIGNLLLKFEKIFILGNGKKMFYGDEILGLKDALEKEKIVNNNDLAKIEENLKNEIIRELKKYKKGNISNIFKGIEFLKGKKQYVQTITLIIEILLTHLCLKHKFYTQDECILNPHKRDTYSKTCYIIAKEIENDDSKWKGSDEQKKRISEVLEQLNTYEKEIIKEIYKNFNEIRNYLNHGGFRKEIDIDNLESVIDNAINNLKKLLTEEENYEKNGV